MASMCRPRGARPARLCRPKGSLLSSLQDILSDYRLDSAARASEDAYWADKTVDLDAAIRRACASTDVYGKRHSHQNRIPAEVMTAAADVLCARTDDIQGASDFEALHQVIKQLIGWMPGIGPMQIYDFATRIGLWLGKSPVLVHLHAGVTIGAKNLGINVRNRATVRPDELPAPFCDLPASEIEDILCIYKEDLLALPR